MKPCLGLFLFVILTLTIGCGAESTNTYHNNKYGYSVEIPQDWHIEEELWDDDKWDNTALASLSFGQRVSVDVAVLESSHDLEIAVRDHASINIEYGSPDKYEVEKIGNNTYRITSLYLRSSMLLYVWSRTYYIAHAGYLYGVSFTATGYGSSELDKNRSKVKAIRKTFHIENYGGLP